MTASPFDLLVAQITDTHVLEPWSTEEQLVDNNARLAVAVAAINAERPRPDVVLATGDLVNNSTPEQTAIFAELVAPLDVPILVLPGNHDDRASLKATFDQPWQETGDDHISWAVDLGPVRLIGLDTIVPGRPGGRFDAEREEWLTATLAEAPDRPTLVAMHHPPFVSGLDVMDGMGLKGIEAFAAVIAANPQVERILCGHLHRPITTTVGGATCTVGVATIEPVALNLGPDAPIEVALDPYGYFLHGYRAGAGSSGQWISHLRYLATGQPPVVPEWAALVAAAREKAATAEGGA
ncbi:MAG: phosphodiesterase [Acidimicrobiales bacterium]